MEQNQETLLDGLGIVEQRGFEIYEQVIDNLFTSDNVNISSVLRALVCDMDLDTKELVWASYVVGKLTAMSDEEVARVKMLKDLASIAKSIVDKSKDI
jgi:hypothetical protein